MDPIFPPPNYVDWKQSKRDIVPDNLVENNKFELIFDELYEG